MTFRATVGHRVHGFADLRELLAKASPRRSGDELAGIAASTSQERVAAQTALADVPLGQFLSESVVPYESDEITRLIVDTHDARAFRPVAHLTVGGLRDWLLSDDATPAALAALAPGLTPEMAAAASKLMRHQDLILAASRCRVVTRFRDTLGLPGTLAVRLQPNHPTDDPAGILASIVDGLMYGAGDAVIGINPAADSVPRLVRLLKLLDDLVTTYGIPTQACVLAHVTNTLHAIEQGAPVDLVFQSIAGTEAANRGFGVSLALLDEAHAAVQGLGRGTVGDNAMYFETGQGSALSAAAHHGVDQQTLEARAYAVARRYRPLLVNTVVGFIGPEYLHDGKQIVRAGLEDHFCGKLLGLPMGCDVCYTNHAEADQDDMDTLLVLLASAGLTYVMGVPGADDVMLNYQSTSFHDALFVRKLLRRRRAPEFEAWLHRSGITDEDGALLSPASRALPALAGAVGAGLSIGEPARAEAESQRGVATIDPWRGLKQYTQARIALGRTGTSLPASEVLRFAAAHAEARDAVHVALDAPALECALQALGRDVIHVHSRAVDRADYLLRPDHGRMLAPASVEALRARGSEAVDLALVVADGLSALAAQRHAPGVLEALLRRLEAGGALRIGPVVVATMARVALADEIGALLGARLSLILLGERPGLAAPDSLGAYLTWAPAPGRVDAQRNCVSNIRPDGQPAEVAAARLAWLVREALHRGTTGIALKDESEFAAIGSDEPPPAIDA